MTQLQSIIENAWNDRSQLKNEDTINAIRSVIDLIDSGSLRVAEPVTDGWQVVLVFTRKNNGILYRLRRLQFSSELYRARDLAQDKCVPRLASQRFDVLPHRLSSPAQKHHQGFG